MVDNKQRSTRHPTKPAGLYLHIPFCFAKCPYCDFYSITDVSLVPDFVEALSSEIKMASGQRFCFDSLYIGGGTPSVLDARSIDFLIETAYRVFQFQPDTEVTLEINPGTVDPTKLSAFKSMGINRLSIGVQSFQANHLDFLGRIHSGKDALNAISSARKAGFDNIGLDFIYGIPNQSEKSWLRDLNQAVDLQPEHLSCYILTFESNTPMSISRQKGLFQPMGERLVGELFNVTTDFLSDQGYQQYEISNFARINSGTTTLTRSRHNQKYWSFAPYVGLGPAAHSFVTPVRYWNYRSLNTYFERINAGDSPVEGKEALSDHQQAIEWIYLGLRKADGIYIDGFNDTFRANFREIFKDLIKEFQEKGFVQMSKSHCFLTRKGMLFTDGIAARFVSLLPHFL